MKRYRNLNEQIDRMKSLMTDDNLYGKLVDKPKVVFGESLERKVISEQLRKQILKAIESGKRNVNQLDAYASAAKDKLGSAAYNRITKMIDDGKSYDEIIDNLSDAEAKILLDVMELGGSKSFINVDSFKHVLKNNPWVANYYTNLFYKYTSKLEEQLKIALKNGEIKNADDLNKYMFKRKEEVIDKLGKKYDFPDSFIETFIDDLDYSVNFIDGKIDVIPGSRHPEHEAFLNALEQDSFEKGYKWAKEPDATVDLPKEKVTFKSPSSSSVVKRVTNKIIQKIRGNAKKLKKSNDEFINDLFRDNGKTIEVEVIAPKDENLDPIIGIEKGDVAIQDADGGVVATKEFADNIDNKIKEITDNDLMSQAIATKDPEIIRQTKKYLQKKVADAGKQAGAPASEVKKVQDTIGRMNSSKEISNLAAFWKRETGKNMFQEIVGRWFLGSPLGYTKKLINKVEHRTGRVSLKIITSIASWWILWRYVALKIDETTGRNVATPITTWINPTGLFGYFVYDRVKAYIEDRGRLEAKRQCEAFFRIGQGELEFGEKLGNKCDELANKIKTEANRILDIYKTKTCEQWEKCAMDENGNMPLDTNDIILVCFHKDLRNTNVNKEVMKIISTQYEVANQKAQEIQEFINGISSIINTLTGKDFGTINKNEQPKILTDYFLIGYGSDALDEYGGIQAIKDNIDKCRVDREWVKSSTETPEEGGSQNQGGGSQNQGGGSQNQGGGIVVEKPDTTIYINEENSDGATGMVFGGGTK
jgi:hypothetical protein